MSHLFLVDTFITFSFKVAMVAMAMAMVAAVVGKSEINEANLLCYCVI